MADRLSVDTSKPVVVDLFCGEGGASKGYADAGFSVVGVDSNFKVAKRYPYPIFIGGWQAGLAFWLFNLPKVALIHASPPCQRYSKMSGCWKNRDYPDLVGLVREELLGYGVPFVIENVPDAPLIDPVTLCGYMFGLELYRHRGFEAHGFTLPQPDEPYHDKPAMKAGRWKPGYIMSVAGHVAPIAQARKAMGIDWMTRDALVEAIPPLYAEFVGLNARPELGLGQSREARRAA